MPAKYLLGAGAVLQQASQNTNTALSRWANGVLASEIQTSVMALGITRAQIEQGAQGLDKKIWLAALDQLENDITVHCGPPLVVDLDVATIWSTLRHSILQSLTPGGQKKNTTQDVRLVIATAMAHKLVLVDDQHEPYHAQIKLWGCQVLVP